MKWLTITQIKAAAKKSDKAAAKCSIEHWEQIINAPEKELRGKLKRTNYKLVYSNHCALCQRGKITGKCKLSSECKSKVGSFNCCSAWYLVKLQIRHWYRSGEYFTDIKPAGQKLIDLIKKEYKL